MIQHVADRLGAKVVEIVRDILQFYSLIYTYVVIAFGLSEW